MNKLLEVRNLRKTYTTGPNRIEVLKGAETAIYGSKGANGVIAIYTKRGKFMKKGVIDNSRKAAYGYDQRLEVFGSKGAAVAENDAPNTVKLSTESGVVGEKPMYFFLERYKDAFIAEMKAFLDALAENQPCKVTGEDGLQDLIVALAAKKSLVEKRTVKISEIQLPALG